MYALALQHPRTISILWLAVILAVLWLAAASLVTPESSELIPPRDRALRQWLAGR